MDNIGLCSQVDLKNFMMCVYPHGCLKGLRNYRMFDSTCVSGEFKVTISSEGTLCYIETLKKQRSYYV